jgi:hypothetical protein
VASIDLDSYGCGRVSVACFASRLFASPVEFVFVATVARSEHDDEHTGNPKMPGEPKRVQPSRDRDLTRRNRGK